jgi:transcriptional regulator GlxA family with amidase domain
MLRAMLAILMILVVGSPAHAGALKVPEGRKIRVAIVLTEGAVVIDYAGPWEVFANVHAGHGATMEEQMPFQLYTVGRDRQPIRTSGSTEPGMTIVPDYGFADAPAPDVVVVGAQSGDAQLGPWLNKVHAQHALIVSVCTGAFRLASAGLLDGKPATTHHAWLQRLANQYPAIGVRSSVRYVESEPLIITAGGFELRDRCGAARGRALLRSAGSPVSRRLHGIPGPGLEDQCGRGHLAGGRPDHTAG